jgi:dihydropteroate synthase
VKLTVTPPTVADATEKQTGWSILGGVLSLERPLVMGILNITPDSFSDGGELTSPQRALERAHAMVREGADLLDVGGESTRPGAVPVSASEQLDRILPVLEMLAAELPTPLSVDTRSAQVARQALASGAAIINDVSALSDPQMAGVVAASGAAVVLMHMRGTPATMQSLAVYGDVVGEVAAELAAALDGARRAGIAEEQIVLDPGLGFAKHAQDSLALLAGLTRLTALGRPLLIGPSRKSFLARFAAGQPPAERVGGTVAACVAALARGARIFRVHDVAPVRQALDLTEAIRQADPLGR